MDKEISRALRPFQRKLAAEAALRAACVSGAAVLPVWLALARRCLGGAGGRLEAVRFAGRADLGACINADAEPGADDGVTFIISDLLTDSDWRAAVDRLLSRRREVMLIQVLSPAELEPKLSGRHTLCGAGESAARITVDIDRDALRAYRETVRVFLSDIRHFCASRAVPYLLMRSDERVEHVLRTEGCMEGLIR